MIPCKDVEKFYHTSKFDIYLATSNIPNGGLGVFTKEYIPANTYIDEYKGEVYIEPIRGSYVLQVSPTCHIDAWNFPRCYMGMLNDCSFIAKQQIRKKKRRIDVTPDSYYNSKNEKLFVNCEFITDEVNKMAYVNSIVEIFPGSELFVAYGDEYWKN